MRFIKIFSVLLLLSVLSHAQSPAYILLHSGKRISLRGLSVVTDNIVWVSGSSGSVGRSTNGGSSWTWITVPGYEKRDFRDIEAFDSSTAIIVAVAEPAVILKTTDGGLNWKKVYEDTAKGIFLDAMDFKDSRNGVAIGDPIDGRQAYLATTTDGGNSWKKTDPSRSYGPLADGEAFFASSGTNIRFTKAGTYVVTGGKRSVLFTGTSQYDSLPIVQGLESTGANSIDVYDGKAVIVGGDFSKDTISSNNCVLVSLGKKPVFSIPETPPHGYRSCVIYLNSNQLVACGTSGIDLSDDGGRNWRLLSRDSFHVVKKAKQGNAVYLAGGNGRIGRLK
ncbi:WD40/YVTN/BNR-like repeat-containing protein [Sediminibacterium ginsengisoli]|uniref:Photosynthesis system II assembly factor Ycf48/Hcf136-like domain-containing protein n=1 Tax=Sediminibacterium ginsengisoli TaxID=413434 RepID=A0A1T4NVY7_9BACT|nr:hypothetical protein [Sediminibacterium ginsengisoli]SJZ83530.1 hypothetical protein SAMN04488132_10518 [Sediminibacterium ginsengisoli]